MATIWNKRTFALVTGASRGIGREIAVDFAARFAADSVIVLVARSSDDLQETKAQILAVQPLMRVEVHCVDLANPSEQQLRDVLATTASNETNFEQAILVHNAGSLGDVAKSAADLHSVSELQDYFTFNVFSMMVLNNVFLTHFPASRCPRLVINITSLCAIKPMSNFALYCTGKAAREMLLNVLAVEDPSVTVLHYSPGPVLTAMADEILNNVPTPETRAMFQEMRDNGRYLTTHQTISKLVQVMDAGTFKSGDHVDYFDTL